MPRVTPIPSPGLGAVKLYRPVAELALPEKKMEACKAASKAKLGINQVRLDRALVLYLVSDR